jgi:uncharacterized protein YbaP (TraB family)
MRWLLVVALMLAACTPKQQCPVYPRPAVRGPAFLWKVHKGAFVVWLYGTIHDGTGLDAVPRVARDALEKSMRFVSELGVQEPDRDEFRALARVKTGPGIDALLPTDDWYELANALRGRIREDDLRRARPWYAMSLLTTYMVPDPGPSMDVLLAKRAQELAMPVEHLETWKEQLEVLNQAVGVKDLEEAIHARESMRCDLGRLRAAYLSGDTPTMQALLVIPRTAESMLHSRNRKWLPKIEGYVGNGGAFVAVGLGHLLGDQGLPAMLQRAGYTVERATL